jgi:hypothetical protein
MRFTILYIFVISPTLHSHFTVIVVIFHIIHNYMLVGRLYNCTELFSVMLRCVSCVLIPYFLSFPLRAFVEHQLPKTIIVLILIINKNIVSDGHSIILYYNMEEYNMQLKYKIKFQYLLASLRSSNSCLRLLPHLLVPQIFPLTMCFRRQFLRNMCPIQLAYLRLVV